MSDKAEAERQSSTRMTQVLEMPAGSQQHEYEADEDLDNESSGLLRSRREEVIVVESSSSSSSSDKGAADDPKPFRKETPLPLMQVSLVAAVLFTDTFSQLLIFPFLPFMVNSFYPDLAKHDIGYRAGYLVGAFYLGSFCFNIYWGQLADAYGRKPIMIMGMVASIISVLLFGISPNFWWALVVRFIWGAANGNIGVGKTLISEVCDDSNSARAFSFSGVMVGFGRIVGPMVGGYLAEPATKYPHIFGRVELLKRYPYFLPCLASSFIGIILTILVITFMKETLPPEVIAKHKKAAAEKVPVVRPSIMSLLRDRDILLSCIVYGLLCLTSFVSNQIYPLWMVADSKHHGYSLGDYEIGKIMSLVGATQMIFQVMIFPYFAARFAVKQMITFFTYVFAASLFMFPAIEYFPRNHYSNIWIWGSMFTVLILMVNSRNTCFTCSFVLVANSCTQDVRATVNGVSQNFAAVGRGIGATLGSVVFAWSLQEERVWPFSYEFVWYVLAALSLLVCYTVSLLPDSIAFMKKIKKPMM